MNWSRRMAGTIAAGMLVAACGGGASAPAGNPGAQPGTKPPAPAAAAASGEAEFGVPECDQYIKKYLACVESKVPDAARATLRESFDRTRQSWKQAAATPEGKSGLAFACTQMLSASKQSMAAYNCEW